MKLLFINGSPHKDGCTAAALREVSRTLEELGIETETHWVGNKPVPGCIACGSCKRLGHAYMMTVSTSSWPDPMSGTAWWWVLLCIMAAPLASCSVSWTVCSTLPGADWQARRLPL